MEPRVVLVDGYNAIKRTPELSSVLARDMLAGREALLDRVVARYRHTPHRVLVVFDGDGVNESTYPLRKLAHGSVIFTQRGVTADAVIIACAGRYRAEGCEVETYSDDGEVSRGAAAHGAHAEAVRKLVADPFPAPRFLRKRRQHQAYIKRTLETDDEKVPRAPSPRDRRGGRGGRRA